ncbi:hypothetical protein [Notoacmeibacter ruber]|uniref:DUF5681 domain-containing protein n=1 Tax=Notoacmeibacter ruber TaxID=2670375 RepID=A0A3L7JEV2_9HYPH|nr:hypothetical protein [Notoacmeibacter ruber]RLQ89318.1 hypothetical protein D8780_01505 [Notoacmeibacter ruber]
MKKPEDRADDAEAGRDSSGRFASGWTGRPKGSRNKATLAAETLLEGEAEELTRKAIELAKNGDTTALRLCLERVVPVRKGVVIAFDMPPLNGLGTISEVASSIISTVAEGTLSPEEGQALIGMIESYRRTLEASDLEQRIKALEEAANGQG